MSLELNQGGESTFGTYAVVRIQLLGFNDILHLLNSQRNHHPAELVRLKDYVAHYYFSLYEMRASFYRFYDLFSNEIPESVISNPALVGLSNKISKGEVGFEYFPDFILIYAPLEAVDTISSHIIYALMSASGETISRYSDKGLSLCGKMNICFGMELTDEFLYNIFHGNKQSLNRHGLIVGDDLYSYLRRFNRIYDVNDYWSVLTRHYADYCLASVIADNNNLCFYRTKPEKLL